MRQRLKGRVGKTKLKNALNKLFQENAKKKTIIPSTNSKTKKTHNNHIQRPKKLPYHDYDTILLLGEGNFSFAFSLARQLKSAEGITATCLDSESILFEKYEDAAENVEGIIEMGGKVLYEIDCTLLSSVKSFKKEKFTKIIFNFPHAG